MLPRFWFSIAVAFFNLFSPCITTVHNKYPSSKFLFYRTTALNERPCTCPTKFMCSCCEYATVLYTKRRTRLCSNFTYQRNGLNIDISLNNATVRTMAVTDYRPLRLCSALPGTLASRLCANVIELNQFPRSLSVCVRNDIDTKTESWQISYTCISISTELPAVPMATMSPGMTMRPASPAPMATMMTRTQMGGMLTAQPPAVQMTPMPATRPPAGQMGAMPPGQTGAMAAGQMVAMPAGQTGAMRPGGQMGAMPPGQMGAMPPGQTGAMTAGQMGAMPAGQTGAMRPGGQMVAMPPGQMGAMPPGQMGAMPAGQTGAMRPGGQMVAMPPGQMGAMPPGQMGAMPAGQMGAMRPGGQMGAMLPGQMGAMPPGQTGAMAPGQMGAMPAGQMGAMRPGGQTGAMPGGPPAGAIVGARKKRRTKNFVVKNSSAKIVHSPMARTPNNSRLSKPMIAEFPEDTSSKREEMWRSNPIGEVFHNRTEYFPSRIPPAVARTIKTLETH